MSELLKISLSSKSISLINDIGRSSQPLAAELRKISRNCINESSKFGANALKSKVPVDTQELRSQFVTTLDQASLTNLEATVGIRPGDHIGRDRKSVDAEWLADLLNKGVHEKTGKPMNRSRQSISTSPFSSSKSGLTAGWVEEGIDEFLQNIQRYLDQRDFS